MPASSAKDINAVVDAHALFAAFPGIVANTPSGHGSHVHAEGDRCVVALVFSDDAHGNVARLATRFVFSRMGEGERLDGKAPIAGNTQSACAGDATRYVCSRRQLAVFARALRYASAAPMGPPYPVAALTTTPLSFLLSHALVAFERDYNARRGSAPPLAVWSNVLRVVSAGGVSVRELAQCAVLSRRGAKGVTRDAERLGWLATRSAGRARCLFLTASGRRARDVAAQRVATVEHEWRARFAGRFDALRQPLLALVRQFDIDLPCYLSGYGPADASVTGGNHMPAQTGPPRVPHHGQDWPVVLRPADRNDAALPLPALLAQTLAMFTIDYEWEISGYGAGLYHTSNLLRHIPDEGLPLARAAALGDVTGNGKSGTERHLVTVVTPGARRDGERLVHLTPKGKRARDAFAHRVLAVEREWRARFGPCAADLRSALEGLDAGFGDNLPDYPDTTAWYAESMIAGAAAARTNRANTADLRPQ